MCRPDTAAERTRKAAYPFDDLKTVKKQAENGRREKKFTEHPFL